MVKLQTMTSASGFSIEEILLLLGMQERTGELVIESGNNIGVILIHKAKILHIHSPYSRAIGDLLVEANLITDEELMETLRMQKKDPTLPLGSMLLKQGKVTFEVIEMMVQEQIRQAMQEFQSWNEMEFHFTDKDIQPYDRIHVSIQEFLGENTVRAALNFLAPGSNKLEPSSAS